MILPIEREGSTSNRTYFNKFESTSQSNQSMEPTTTRQTSDVATTPFPAWNWDDFSALKLFDENMSRRWFRDDIENFLLPKSTMLREKFDSVAKRMTQSMFKDHPIKIETFTTDGDNYVLSLDVHDFKPEELQVKVTDDMLSVTGKHENKRNEMNYSVQEYSRKHSLPPGVKADDVKCNLNSNGILTISAPKKPTPQLTAERNIPIQHFGMPRIKV